MLKQRASLIAAIGPQYITFQEDQSTKYNIQMLVSKNNVMKQCVHNLTNTLFFSISMVLYGNLKYIDRKRACVCVCVCVCVYMCVSS